MTSIYSIISIETKLVTHFSGYKTITLHEEAMLCFKPRFSLFRLLKYYKILQKYSFCIVYSDILNELETIVYSLYFKKQTLELLLHLSFKAELSYLGLKFSQILSRKGNFRLYRMVK